MGLEEARAAFARGRNVIVVAPPAVEHAEAVWELLDSDPATSRPHTLILCAAVSTAAEWADHARAGSRVHPVTGLARTERVLASGAPPMVAGSAKDVAALVARSVLKLDAIRTVVLAWLEDVPAADQDRLIDPLLAEAAEARRIVLTWDPTRLPNLLERHAHRAPIVGQADINTEGRPAGPAGPATFAVVSRPARAAATRAVIDRLAALQPFVWHRGCTIPSGPFDVVVCMDLPDREEFLALSVLAEPVLLLSATQLSYARALAAPLKPVSLPSAADLARDWAEELRATISGTIERANLGAELAVLAPLLERHDPAEVAAALLALTRQPPALPSPSSSLSATGSLPEPPPHPEPQAWTKVFINVGKKDRAAAKDLVGALIREAKLAKEEIGRVDLRETFSLVELAPGAVDRTLQAVTDRRVMIRGRRVTARRERER